ncbi:MAG: hypothetical protein V1701_10915 [Planctomycetota bacterium]
MKKLLINLLLVIGVICLVKLSLFRSCIFVYPRNDELSTRADIVELVTEVILSTDTFPKDETEFLDKVKGTLFIDEFRKRKMSKKLNQGGYLDRWERPIRYVYIKDDKDGGEHFLLYSYGKNGIDEKGKGDDLFSTDYVYWSEKERRFTIDYEAKAAGILTEEYRKIHPWPKQEDKSVPVPDSGKVK